MPSHEKLQKHGHHRHVGQLPRHHAGHSPQERTRQAWATCYLLPALPATCYRLAHQKPTVCLIAISRPSNSLHFIAKGTPGPPTLVGENINFDIVKYLPGTGSKDNEHLWTLPPVTEVPADAPGVVTPDPAVVTPDPAAAIPDSAATIPDPTPATQLLPSSTPAPAPRLAQAAEIVAITKRGRAVRRPKHLRQ